MRILVIRTSALGDIVHCLPVLTALRRHLPRARIGWMVEETMSPLLQDHPDLDELLTVRLRDWRKEPLAGTTVSGVREFLGDLRRFSADVVLDLMGNHKAGVLAGLSLADRCIGPARPDRREPSSAVWINEPVRPSGDHAVERALSLLAPLGVPPEPPDFGGEKLFPGAEAVADLPDGYFVVHPGAAWPNKRYPAHLWGEVARRIAAQSGLSGFVVAGPSEGDLAAAAARTADGALTPVDTAGLRELSAVLRSAALVLAGDTGPLHLAHALGAPVLCLMGPTNPATHGPYGRPKAALWRELPCSFCHRRLEEPKACLTLLQPETVTAQALDLLL